MRILLQVDVDSSRDVVVEDLYCDGGDDGVCMKSGKYGAGARSNTPTRDVEVTQGATHMSPQNLHAKLAELVHLLFARSRHPSVQATAQLEREAYIRQ